MLDVTEAEADKLLVTLDPLASLAEANPDALTALSRRSAAKVHSQANPRSSSLPAARARKTLEGLSRV
jgi:hypothetical protein